MYASHNRAPVLLAMGYDVVYPVVVDRCVFDSSRARACLAVPWWERVGRRKNKQEMKDNWAYFELFDNLGH